MSWLTTHYLDVLNVILVTVGAASVVVAAVAPLTKTDSDDKWAVRLKKAHDLLSKVSLNVKK